MQGRDSWAGRPRDVETIRVSQLSEPIKKLWKKRMGKQRWATKAQLKALLALEKFAYAKEE